MPCRILSVALAIIWSGLPVTAGDPSWKGKDVILTRAGVKLEMPGGEKIAPRTSGIARDVTFQVLEDKDNCLLIESPRQRGWVARGDAVPVDQAVTYFNEQLARNPKDGHAFMARGVVLMSKAELDKSLAEMTRRAEEADNQILLLQIQLSQRCRIFPLLRNGCAPRTVDIRVCPQ